MASSANLLKESPWQEWDSRQKSQAISVLDTFADKVTYETLAETATTRRTMFSMDLQLVTLPRFFSWVYAFQFAVMSTPRNFDDVLHLRAVDIDLVISLTQEEPLPEKWFEQSRMAHAFLPIPNYEPPTLRQADEFIALVEDAWRANRRVLVHCGGGKGRAGTLAACLILKYGLNNRAVATSVPQMTAQDAILHLRTLRPGSIETPQQEAFIHEFCSELWRRSSIAVEPMLWPGVSTPMQVEGLRAPPQGLMVFCGLPGSGKSTLAAKLNCGTVISGDELGGRMAVEEAIGKNGRCRSRWIVDRCHASIDDRKAVLDLAFNPSNAVCVALDVPEADCRRRVAERLFHPTIKFGGGLVAIDHFAKRMHKPTQKEGFQTVFHLSSPIAVEEFIALCLTHPQRLQGFQKFPRFAFYFKILPSLFWLTKSAPFLCIVVRTQHLVSLGAATRDDLIISDSAVWLQNASRQGVVWSVTEKLDGANLGIRLDETGKLRAQNRSHFVQSDSHSQFAKLSSWLARHGEELRAILESVGPQAILFGEWLAATHSISYDRLPDFFVAFDIMVEQDKFMSRAGFLNTMAKYAPTVATAPEIQIAGLLSVSNLTSIVQSGKSKFRQDGCLEGVVVKFDKGDVMVSRSKIVRAGFIAGNEHWTSGKLKWNGLSHA